MLALGIRYLNDFAVASHGRYEQVEWPPHPGRVFMALVAGHFETGADAAEREALIWLESLPHPPEIHAGEDCLRTTVVQYVPVNDDAKPCYTDSQSKKAKFHQEIQGTLLRRNRQPRTFARTCHNQRWIEEIRSILEAFFHARTVLELAVRYGRELDAAPQPMPSGWAAVLYLFDFHCFAFLRVPSR